MDGQVSGLGTVHPLLTLSFFGTWILPLHFNVEEEVVVIRVGWTPKKKRLSRKLVAQILSTTKALIKILASYTYRTSSNDFPTYTYILNFSEHYVNML